MKLTQKKVKELIALNIKEKEEIYTRFVIACGRLNREDMEIITKYNFIGGQIYAYQKVLQIMQLKVK